MSIGGSYPVGDFRWHQEGSCRSWRPVSDIGQVIWKDWARPAVVVTSP